MRDLRIIKKKKMFVKPFARNGKKQFRDSPAINLLNTTNDPCTTLITFIDNRSLIPTLSRPGTFYHAS